MTPLFADAFFFVALLNPKDRAHEPARSYVEPDLDRPLVTTTWVLVEVADAMATTARNRDAFLRLYRALRSNPAVEVVPGDDRLESGLDLFARRPDKAWSLTDCISFVVMADRGLAEALTGGHHFEQAGFRALLRD
jgi:predicted nucleic acid-binding protein